MIHCWSWTHAVLRPQGLCANITSKEKLSFSTCLCAQQFFQRLEWPLVSSRGTMCKKSLKWLWNGTVSHKILCRILTSVLTPNLWGSKRKCYEKINKSECSLFPFVKFHLFTQLNIITGIGWDESILTFGIAAPAAGKCTSTAPVCKSSSALCVVWLDLRTQSTVERLISKTPGQNKNHFKVRCTERNSFICF